MDAPGVPGQVTAWKRRWISSWLEDMDIGARGLTTLF